MRLTVSNAMVLAKNFIFFDEPRGDWGSFEPISANYNASTGTWEVKCRYTKNKEIRMAIVQISDSSAQIIDFKVVEK